MPKERGESGQYIATVGPEDVLAVFDRVDGPPVVTSADVADMTGISRDSARRKLEELEQRGDVGSRRSAGRVLYWRKADREQPSEPQGEVSSRATAHGETRGQPTRPGSLADVEFPQNRDRRQCETAVLAVRDYLREHGPASMREIVTAVMPEHPVGYDVPELEPGDRYRGAWWRRVVKPGLKALPHVQAPSRGASDWSHQPDTVNQPNPHE